MIPTTASVLIIGAGPSGLVALKELREAKIEAVAIDQRSNFGGVFAPSSGVTYDNLYLTTSNMFMAFSDYPPLDSKMKYWSQREYYEYLESYVNHFALRPHIHFNTTVQHANLDTNDKWQVTLLESGGKQGLDNKSVLKIFDYLVVATGSNHTPYVPPILEGFNGEILHSQDYHRPEQVKGKNVLVIGTGESSADVVASAARAAKKVTAWSRHLPNIAPRFLVESLIDANYNEGALLANQDCADYVPGSFLDAATTSRMIRNFPLGVWATVLQKGLCEDVKRMHGTKSAPGLMGDWNLGAFEPDFFSGDTSSVPTKCCVMCTVAAQGKLDLVVAPRVKCNDGKTIIFEEPTYHGIERTKTRNDIAIEVDTIVFCTGYQLSFDWLEAPELDTNPRYWFKHAFPTNGKLAEKMAFLGYARPHQGGIPQCSEMIARYVAQLLVSLPQQVSLPSNYKEMALSEGACEEDCFHMSKHVLPLVDYSSFMVSMSRLIGCEPTVPLNPFQPSLMVKYWTFPLWSCFFRTTGVGAKPETCHAVLDKFGTFDGLVPMPLLAIAVALTFLTPFLNALFYVTRFIVPQKKEHGLWWGYKFRSSKMYLLSGYELRLKNDLILGTMAQWVVGIIIILYGLVRITGLYPAVATLVKIFSGSSRATTKKAA